MIQHERYLRREEWYKIKNGDRVRIERTDGTTIEGVVKCIDKLTGFDIGPYYMAFAYIKSLKMIKAHDPNEEIRNRLAKALYGANEATFAWERTASHVKERYLKAVDAVLEEQKRIASVTNFEHSESSCIPGVCNHDE